MLQLSFLNSLKFVNDIIIFMQYLKQLIEKSCNYFVRPPRYEYNHDVFEGTMLDGTVKEIGNAFGLVYTYIRPVNHHTTVVYLHSSLGCQKQGFYLDSYVRHTGMALLLFDFEGCGNSKGQYITLGLKEADQILKMITLVHQRNRNKFVLWGRSMGATTVLRYLQTYGDENIVCAIIDSPYKSLRMLVYDMMPYVPNFLLEAVFEYICKVNARKIGYDLANFQVFSKMREIKCPILFLASRIDDYVPFGHTYDLFRHKRGNKQLIQLFSDHTEPRSNYVTSRCVMYIQEQLDHYAEDLPTVAQTYSEPEIFRIE